MKLLSLNESSILRKFAVFFLLVSVVPLLVLFYFYIELNDQSGIELSINDITNILLLVTLGIVCGYWAMRRIIIGFLHTAEEGQRALASTLKDKSSALHTEINETAALSQTFRAINDRLEDDRRNLEFSKRMLHAVITKISVGLASNNNINGFMHLIVETATEALNAKSGMALLIDKGSGLLKVRTIVGAEGIAANELGFSPETSVFSTVMKHQKAIIINSLAEVKDSSQQSLTPFDFPMICAPLLVQEQVLGILVICGKKDNRLFQEDDLSLLYNMALQAAVAINNEEIKNLANIDPLTGVFNYRHMIAVLDYETLRLQRYPGNLTLLMIDMDDFKSYNDQYGHPEGDLLLVELTKRISKRLRASDVFCRYGGDEFALILPQTSLTGALFVANKIKEVGDSLNLKRKVSLSIGGAEWAHPMTRHDLLVKADKALLRAKQQGKDKILLI